MAIDSQSSLDSGRRASVIENEIPAYRAVSARAVTSLVFALASVFCFIHLYFWLVVVAAVLFGWSALVAIRRYPEILTGTRLAWTGIILASVLGVTATARQGIEWLVLRNQATNFARLYMDVLKKESLANAVWYMQNTDYRKEKTPEAILDELKQIKTPPNLFETQTQDIANIQDRLKEPNAEIHFVRIENQLVDGLTHYANALLDVDGPATAKHSKEESALIELVKEPNGGNMDWKVRSVRFPYKPASVGLEADHPIDDGHGHGH